MSLKFVPKGPIDNNPTFGLDDGLAPTRRQAIVWTNDAKITDAYMCHWALTSLMHFVNSKDTIYEHERENKIYTQGLFFYCVL